MLIYSALIVVVDFEEYRILELIAFKDNNLTNVKSFFDTIY